MPSGDPRKGQLMLVRREGEELSRRVMYLNGELKVTVSRGGRAKRDDDAPEAPAGYAANCGRVARVQVGKVAGSYGEARVLMRR